MANPDPTLVLTRPEPQSLSFLEDVATRLGRMPRTIISPVLRIERVAGSADLASYRGLIVTSGNAVTVLGSDLRNRRVFTVGEQTAEKARAMGARATCLGGTVDDLIARIKEVEGPALHIRGTHSRGELSARARAAGVAVDEYVAYDQIECELTPDAQETLIKVGAVVPLFSPRSAAMVAQYARHPDTLVIAMSGAVADAWNGFGHVAISERPDRSAMLDKVVEAF